MPNLTPRIDRLKAMLGLEEKRVTLQRQLDDLNQQLSTLRDRLFDETPTISTKSSATAKGSRKGRSQRGQLKEQVLAALSAAGAAGVRVTDLASALGVKAANIHAWFHSTGKRVSGISKVGGGHYRLTEGADVSKAAKPAKATKAAKSPSTKGKRSNAKGKGTKRGALASSILSALEAAGADGMTVKQIAEKTGAKYRNVSVWFVTTGKKNANVKKIAPGHYKLVS